VSDDGGSIVSQSSSKDESSRRYRKHERKHKKTKSKFKCGKRKGHSKRSRSHIYNSSDEDESVSAFHQAFNSNLQQTMPFMNPFQFYNPNAMLPGAFIAPPYNQSMLVPPVTNVTCKNTTCSVSASASVTTPTKFHSMQFTYAFAYKVKSFLGLNCTAN
jgi:hypothetical protein